MADEDPLSIPTLERDPDTPTCLARRPRAAATASGAGERPARKAYTVLARKYRPQTSRT